MINEKMGSGGEEDNKSLRPDEKVDNALDKPEEIPIAAEIEQAHAELDMIGAYLKNILIKRLEDFGGKVKDGLKAENPDYDSLDKLAHELNDDLDAIKQKINEKIEVERFTENIPAELIPAAVRYDMRRQELEVFREKFSHDFCGTPMNTIVGFLDVLARKKDLSQEKRDKEHELIDIAVGTYPTFLKRITLLADKPKFGSIPAERILDVERDIMKGRANSKGVDFIVDMPEGFECYSDKGRVDAILRNLVNNAIKFTKEGNITLSVKAEGDKIKFSVSDTGRGIGEENLKNFQSLFDKHNNPDKFQGKIKSHAGTGGEKGTGKGMITCRRSADDILGEISVETEKDKGTKFTLVIPADKQDLLVDQAKARTKKEKEYREKLEARLTALKEAEEEALRKKTQERVDATLEINKAATVERLKKIQTAGDPSYIKKRLEHLASEKKKTATPEKKKTKKFMTFEGELRVFSRVAPKTFAIVQRLGEYADQNGIDLSQEGVLPKNVLELIETCVNHATITLASKQDLEALSNAVDNFLADKNS